MRACVKNSRKALSAIFLIVFVFSIPVMAGCSDIVGKNIIANAEEQKIEEVSSKTIGIWDIQGFSDPTLGNLEDKIDMLKDNGTELSIVFYKNNIVEARIGKDSEDEDFRYVQGDWKVNADKENTIDIVIDGVAQEAVIDPNSKTMIMEQQDGVKMECVKREGSDTSVGEAPVRDENPDNREEDAHGKSDAEASSKS